METQDIARIVNVQGFGQIMWVNPEVIKRFAEAYIAKLDSGARPTMKLHQAAMQWSRKQCPDSANGFASPEAIKLASECERAVERTLAARKTDSRGEPWMGCDPTPITREQAWSQRALYGRY